MDDIIILTQTKRQYVAAKKKLKQILCSLKLQYSPKKTKMGLLTRGFHFLGIEFKTNSAQAESKAETQIQPSKIQVELHARSCSRALAQVRLMNASSVHPEKIQSYLSGWATWWSRTASVYRRHCLTRWVEHVKVREPSVTWLCTGLSVP